MNNRKNRVRNTILSMIVLASMVLTGCTTLFGEIKGGTKMDKFFDEFGNLVNLKQSTRGDIDLRLNFDGEYEGSKYASSYLDAFYISTDLSNSTDDLTYFQMLDFRDTPEDHYTVYCYQTHPYVPTYFEEEENGKIVKRVKNARSDSVIVKKAEDIGAYIMYPEIIVDEKLDVDPNTLITVLATYDYTKGGRAGYREIGRWSTQYDYTAGGSLGYQKVMDRKGANFSPDSYVFAKTIYGNDSPTNDGAYYVKSYCIVASGVVLNYDAESIRTFVKDWTTWYDTPFSTDLNEAFDTYIHSKDMAKTDLAKSNNNYEIEVYNLSAAVDEEGTIIYIDMTASTTNNSTATAEDEELVAKYDRDDYDGSEDGEDYEELSEEEAEAEAQEFQKTSGSWDFIACVVDKDMGDLEIFGGPITKITNDQGQTKDNLYWVKYAGEVKRIHGIRAVIANKPELGNFKYLIDHNGNAPFPIMALYETNNVFDHEWDKEIDGDVCTEYDWKKIVNEDCYEDYDDEWYDSEDEYLKELQDDDEDYVTAYNIEKTYYLMLEEKSALLDYGLGRTFEAPATTKESPLLYNGVTPVNGSENYVNFPMKLTGNLKINVSPLTIAAVRKSGSSGRYYFPLTIEDAHLSGVVFNNTDSAENKFTFLNDDFIVGWQTERINSRNVDRIYGTPKKISYDLWFPDNFSDIYKYKWISVWADGVNYDYDVAFPYAKEAGEKMQIDETHKGNGGDLEPHYDGFSKGLESVDFVSTERGGYLLAVAPGYVEATKSNVGFNPQKKEIKETEDGKLYEAIEPVEPEVFKIDTSKFAQSVSEVTETELTFTAKNTDEATLFWDTNPVTRTKDASGNDISGADISQNEKLSFDFSSDDGVNAGIFLFTAYSGDKMDETTDVTVIIAADGVYFYTSSRELLQDPVPYDVIEKALETKNQSELENLGFSSELIRRNWATGANFMKEIKDNLHYRFKISFSERTDGGANVTIEDVSKDSFEKLATFTISKKDATAGKIKSIAQKQLEKVRKIPDVYFDSIAAFVADSIQVETNTYTKYKVKSSHSLDALGAKNISMKSGTFDGKNTGDWWTCTTALYGMGFQMKDNTDVFYIPTFQRIQHTLNTNSVYDPNQVYIGNSEELKTEIVSLDGGIACYGIYNNVDKNEKDEYPYVFLGYDTQGNVYTEMEMVRAKIIPFGIKNESFEKKTYVNNVELSRIFKPFGSDSVIYYLKDSFVNRNGQEIVYESDYDPDAELDKVTGKVTSYVLNTAGEGVPNIEWSLYEGNNQVKYAISDDAGFALLRHIPEGEYWVYASSMNVDFATFKLEVGDKGKIESIEIYETLDCDAEVEKIGTNQVQITISNFEGVDPEDAITGRLYGYIYNSKGKSSGNVFAKLEGPVTMQMSTGDLGTFFMRKIPEGEYKLTLSQNGIEFAYFSLNVGPLGRIQSFDPIEVYDVKSYELSFNKNSAKVSLYGFDGATDRRDKPKVDPVKPEKKPKEKKNSGKVDDNKKKITKPTNTKGTGSISDKIDEFLGDVSGDELDVSGTNLDLSGLKFKGEGFEVEQVEALGDQALGVLDSLLEWLKEHAKLLLLILLLIILIITAYIVYRKKNDQPVIPDKVKEFFYRINIFKNINFREIFKFKKK